MQAPKVDYSELSPKTLSEPRFSHLLLLLGWPVYFLMYFLTERLIPAESCTPVHCILDDLIPFCEVFVIPYVGWYLLIVGSLLWFALYNTKNFKRLQIYIIVTQALAMTVYILFPSRQELRPLLFPRDNLLTDIVALLYAADTNTGVCPSLHCAYSLGIASVWLKEDRVSRKFKLFIVIFVILVCLSTMFIKQHSAVDFFAALPVCLVAELISCRDYWTKEQSGFAARRRRRPEQ